MTNFNEDIWLTIAIIYYQMVEKKQQMPLEESKYSQEGSRFLAKGDKDLKGSILFSTL